MSEHSHANSSDPVERAIFRFDDVVVDTQNFQVTSNGGPVTLTPRAFDVLRLLLRHHGQVVEKRQIFDEIWGDTFVSDNSLTKVIKELRHTLGDSAGEPKFIETIPKRGYRFIAQIEDTTEDRTASTEPTIANTASTRPWVVALGVVIVVALAGGAWALLTNPTSRDRPSTIAVLPFKPLDAGSRDESLELGMAATLITRLSNLRDVVVRPIGSSRKFSDPAQDPIDAGKQLQVEAVLDGSIQKVGERVRVSVRLLDVRSGSALWAEHFDENFTDIFKVQDSIAQRIANVLALRLSRNEQEQLAKHMTENPAAFEMYLRGQFQWHRRGPDWIRQSLAAYKQALELDPNFALAHIGVADAYIMLSGHRQISLADAEANAEPSIMRALEIDNSLALAHNAHAELKYQYQYDWDGAETEFKTAIELNPNVAWIRQAYGWFLMCDGRFEEAAVQMDTARQLDPSSLTLSVARGRLYYFSRQYDQAIEQFERVIEIEPKDTSTRNALMSALARVGRYQEAVDIFIEINGLDAEHPDSARRFRDAFKEGGWEGFLRQNLAEMRRLETHQRVAPAAYAPIYTLLADRENAFDAWDKVFDERDVAILQFKIEPANDTLRGDPRFAQLLQRIGQKP